MVFAWRGPCAAFCLPFVEWFRRDQQPAGFLLGTISFLLGLAALFAHTKQTMVLIGASSKS